MGYRRNSAARNLFARGPALKMKIAEKITILSLALLAAILIAVSSSLSPGITDSMTAGLVAPIAANKASENSQIQILFAGDMMLDRGVQYYAKKNGGNGFVFSQIHDKLLTYDLVVANLEGPVTNNSSISITAKLESPESFYFTFDPTWAETLSDNNIRLVNLGNNHILNFLGSGLTETKEYLKKAGIDYFGAPDYPKSASIEVKGVKITFINYNEFATYGDIGAKITIEEIKKAKIDSDIVVVYAHWGAEYVQEPPSQIKTLARQFIDAGADLIIGSHPHVIQPIEIYKGKRIYYSLGNFIFDQYFSEQTKNGLGVVLKIDVKKRQLEFEEINFYMQPNSQTVIIDK